EIVHFTNGGEGFEREIKHNSAYIRCPVSDDCSDSAMRLWMTFKKIWEKENFTHVVVFGGIFAMVCGPVIAHFLQTRLVTLIRGNDFDSSIMSPRKQAYLLNALKVSDSICTVSNDKREMICKLFPEKRVIWIPNGINCNQWKTTPLQSSISQQWRAGLNAGSKTVILLIGHLKYKKGIPFILESCITAGLTNNLLFVLTGECDERTDEYINANTQITIVKEQSVAHTDVCIRYAGVDFVALPSFYDGMPNVMLEAAACARPQIVSKCGGMSDLLIDNKHCFAFNTGNKYSCADALGRASNVSKQQYDSMSRAIYDDIACVYTEERESNMYQELFKC
ncbi:MAG: glycosyltransferase family 4 protein, partial [Fibrobacterota bacterium]|nr:glycosyltransferase [Chitinispirillaceae bacterium]